MTILAWSLVGLLASAQDERDRNIGVLKRPPIIEAALQGNVDGVKARMAKGDKVDLRDSFGATPLTTAAWAGHTDVVKLLVANGADVDIADRSGNTPLMGAAVGNDREMAAVLVKKGAKLTVENKDGENALTLAARSGSDEVLRVLSEHGAKLDARTTGGQTPLVIAATSGQVSSVQFLLESGVDINGTTQRGQTALMAAADNWRTDVVRLLLARGADVTQLDATGRTALDIARARKRKDIVTLLESPPPQKPKSAQPDLARKVEERSDAPQLISSNIDDNDMAVDPALAELVLTFDRPMNTKRYHLFHSARARLGRFPELVGDEPTFFRNDRTYVLRVKLQPNTRYAISMNDDHRLEFRSAKGVPLEPIIFYFRTAALDQEAKKPAPPVEKEKPALRELYKRLVANPTKENYLEAYGAVILDPAYNAYASQEMGELAGAETEKERRRVLARMDEAPPNVIFSPRAHAFAALAAKKIGDEQRWKEEVQAAGQLVRAIIATGNGTEMNPYIILRLSDQDDVLTYLEKQKVSRYSAQGAKGFCDVFRCQDGTSIWFKVPPQRN